MDSKNFSCIFIGPSQSPFVYTAIEEEEKKRQAHTQRQTNRQVDRHCKVTESNRLYRKSLLKSNLRAKK